MRSYLSLLFPVRPRTLAFWFSAVVLVLGLPEASRAANIAAEGTPILGVNNAIDSDSGTPRFQAGMLANINDNNLSTRVDNWWGGGDMGQSVSFVGVLFPQRRKDDITTLTLTMATFFDGGWFGVPNASPGSGGALVVGTHLVEPTLQVTSDGGLTWTTVAHSSDYLSAFAGHLIGGGGQPNPSSRTAVFTLTTAATDVNGIRIIGTNGGNAGADANGFIGVFELMIDATPFVDTDMDGMADDWEQMFGLVVGVNDSGLDPDDDFLTNLEEFLASTDPTEFDTDGDGLGDGDEVTFYGTDPILLDTDGDGLTDGEEVDLVTNPLLADTDSDGLSDGDEVNVYGTNPLVADTDGDGFPDGREVALGSDPLGPLSFPTNLGLLGSGTLGTKTAIDNDPGGELFNSGVRTNINDGNLATRVDTFNGSGLEPVSFVGILWAEPLTKPISRLELTLATFGDGGWFGPNLVGPGAGGALTAPTHLSEPTVQITTDGGATWMTVAHTSDYLTALEGHRIGGGGVPNPSSVTAEFTLDPPAEGISGVRILGTEGGTASRGFIGVFELEAHTLDTDVDNDNMDDSWETQNGLIVGVDDSGEDADSDGLTNLEEFQLDTNPQVADTDGDGLSDGDEVHVHGTNPLRVDTDGDGLSDADEINVHGTNPLAIDTDGDGFSDGLEIAEGTNPNNPDRFPNNFSFIGSGILGVRQTVSAGPEQLVFNAGSSAAINDGNLATRVDSFSALGHTASFVGILWPNQLTVPILSVEFTVCTFFDGGWFGPNNVGPGSGGTLSAGAHLSEPNVEITTDGGNTWTVVGHTSDYLAVLNGHPLPAVDFGAPTAATARFVLNDPAVGINGIRLVGSEGGTASGGFLGVWEFVVRGFTADSDNDGMDDSWEELNGLIVGVDDSAEDPDMDGLSNLREFQEDTNPQVADSDGDGLSDGDEVNTHLTDPLVADTDGDGLSDGDEVNVHGTDPLLADTDGDGSRDGEELALGSDPLSDESYVINIAPLGTGLLGTKVTVDAGLETPRFNGGVGTSINDGNLATRVDSWNGNIASVGDMASFVGISWITPRVEAIVSLRLRIGTFGDGGWFGVNNLAPAAGQPLTPAHIAVPRVEITTDGGATWTPVTSMSDYLAVAEGHLIGGGGQPNPTAFNSVYVLDTPTAGVDGIRLIGTEGGTASGGFLGVFELETFILAEDSDNDGMEDSWERLNGLTVGVDDSAEDPDGDDLSNVGEFEADTNPQVADTDGDGLNDGAEVLTHGTNPLLVDTDGDGLSDSAEVLTHGTNPLLADTDGDGTADGAELAVGSDPLNPSNFPVNVARLGTGLLGTKVSVDSGLETPRFNSGVAGNIVDGNLTTRVDNWNGNIGSVGDMASFVGVRWTTPIGEPVVGIRLRMATFGDGGWFGVNNLAPAAGQPLTPAHIAAPRVEITTDGGTTWAPVASTSDYLARAEGHRIGGGGQPNPTAFTSVFLLDTPVANINGIRLIGTEGGTASGGFIGVFEFEAFVLAADVDEDGMEDGWERRNGLIVGVNDAGLDPDGDGLTNAQEFEANTNPQSADTDGDGVRDGDELLVHNTDPLRADTDGDGLSDGLEINNYQTNPLVTDSDGDGFRDGFEVSQGSNPADPDSIPNNIAMSGTAILGTKVALDSGLETARFNSGLAGNINDGNFATRVDNFNGGTAAAADTVSFVGIRWAEPVPAPIASLVLTLATFGDGGWFGVNNSSPPAGQPLTSAHLVEPRVEVTSDGGATWTPVAYTSDYLSALDGHLIGGGGQPNPTSVSATFVLDTPAGGINGIRIIGTEGGTASGGFIGVFELETNTGFGPALYNLEVVDDQFRFQFDSENGVTYDVQYKDSISASWQHLLTIVGDGTTQQVADMIDSELRIYRVVIPAP